MWSWVRAGKRFVLLEGSCRALADSGPWGLCFLSLSLLPVWGSPPCSSVGLGAAVQPSGIRCCRRLVTEEGRIKASAAVTPAPFFSRGCFLPPYISLWGDRRLGWGALASWQHCPRGLDLAVGCGVPPRAERFGLDGFLAPCSFAIAGRRFVTERSASSP